MAAKQVSIEFANRNYRASVDGGPGFFVGRKVSYEGNWGLMNLTPLPETTYSSEDYRDAFGFWADFLRPIAQCESGGAFQCLNTYDRARFTFGFLQYAAHVPGGDFVKFFRRLLGTPLGADYFPELAVSDGVICRVSEAGATPLESAQSTLGLQDYLNPSREEVEEAEVIQAAKFVHWSLNDAQHRELQVRCGVEHLKAAVQQYARTYSLDGALDTICLVIADIHHQGRGKKIEVFEALNTNGDVDQALVNLLEIGQAFYPQRIATLRTTIDAMVSEGRLGQHKYDTMRGDFVPLIATPSRERSRLQRRRTVGRLVKVARKHRRTR